MGDIDDTTTDDNREQTNPVLFLYDCEATGFSIYDDHITEIAAKVVGVPLSSVSQPFFSSLIHTPRKIPKKGKNKVLLWRFHKCPIINATLILCVYSV